MKSVKKVMIGVGLVVPLTACLVSLMSQRGLASDICDLPSSIEVTKTVTNVTTAQCIVRGKVGGCEPLCDLVTYPVVQGTITIRNVGENPACIGAIEDCLEVHFPKSPKWNTINCVNRRVGFAIPVGEPGEIPYRICAPCGSFTGANSMRNVVTVTLLNSPKGRPKEVGPKDVTTRSASFTPPADCTREEIPCERVVCGPVIPRCGSCAGIPPE